MSALYLESRGSKSRSRSSTESGRRFTAQSARRLASDVFGDRNFEVETYGNVLAASAVLDGLGGDDLHQAELDAHAPMFEVTVATRAVKRL